MISSKKRPRLAPKAASATAAAGAPAGEAEERAVELVERSAESASFAEELKLFERCFFRQYAAGLLQHGYRHDARRLNDSRPLSVVSAGLKHVHGSSLVSLGNDTRVLCGVKGMLAPPVGSDSGRLRAKVILCPTARDGVTDDVMASQDEAGSLADFVVDMLNACNTINYAGLCLQTGVLVWSVHVDLYVLDSGGSLRDACVIAAARALREARLPVMEVGEDGSPQPVSPARSMTLGIERYPIAVSFGVLADQLISDSTRKEEPVLSTGLTVVYDSTGQLRTVYKPGGAPIHDDQLRTVIDLGRTRAARIRRSIEGSLTG